MLLCVFGRLLPVVCGLCCLLFAVRRSLCAVSVFDVRCVSSVVCCFRDCCVFCG